MFKKWFLTAWTNGESRVWSLIFERVDWPYYNSWSQIAFSATTSYLMIESLLPSTYFMWFSAPLPSSPGLSYPLSPTWSQSPSTCLSASLGPLWCILYIDARVSFWKRKSDPVSSKVVVRPSWVLGVLTLGGFGNFVPLYRKH